MSALFLALLVAAAGITPLLIARAVVGAAITATISFLVLWFLLYVGNPSLVWPLGGAIGAFIVVMWIASTLVASMIDEDNLGKTIWLPIVGVVIYAIAGLIGSEMFRANDYAKLIGDFEQKEWTQDVQPADPKHIRLVPEELALYLADKQLAQAPGAIGSQFVLDTKRPVLQRVKGQLWWVIPLDYKGWRVWTSTDGVPGYIMVHADDPTIQPVLVQDKMVYTPGAYFGDNLERHVWANGYMNIGLTDFTLEVDEDGKAWWVITTFKPTITFWGEKITGVVIVDPITGETKHYIHSAIPEWVDRAIPKEFVDNYVDMWGSLQEGWWNTKWSHNNMMKGEVPAIVYGSEGDAFWAVGTTSNNEKDASLVGLFYINSRTGDTVRYHATGATDTAAIQAIDNQVAFKKWHGISPTLYNLYGIMTSVVPILGVNHTFQGVGLMRVDNQQTVIADNLADALRQYQKLLAGSGNQVAPENAHNTVFVEGIVDRFAQEVRGGNSTYYVHLIDFPHLFTGGGDQLSAPKLPMTEIGEKVKIGYIASDEDVLPMISFDNLDLPLTTSPAQKQMREETEVRREDATVRADAHDARVELQKLSPKQLQELMRLQKQAESAATAPSAQPAK